MVVLCRFNSLFHVLSEVEGCLHVHFSAINHDVLERFRPAETTIALLARPRSIWIRASHPFEPRSQALLRVYSSRCPRNTHGMSEYPEAS